MLGLSDHDAVQPFFELILRKLEWLISEKSGQAAQENGLPTLRPCTNCKYVMRSLVCSQCASGPPSVYGVICYMHVHRIASKPSGDLMPSTGSSDPRSIRAAYQKFDCSLDSTPQCARGQGGPSVCASGLSVTVTSWHLLFDHITLAGLEYGLPAGGSCEGGTEQEYLDKYFSKEGELYYMDQSRRSMHKELRGNYERNLSWARSLGIGKQRL